MDVEDFEKKKFDATAEKKIIHCFSTFDFFFPDLQLQNVLFELNWQKSRIYEICDINSWCWREKKTWKITKKKHDFLEVKRKEKKTTTKKQTFITTQLLLWPRSLSYYIHP